MYTHTYIYIHMYAHVYTCVYYIYIYIYIERERDIHMHIYVYIYMYIVYLSLYTCIHIYIYIYIYTCIQPRYAADRGPPLALQLRLQARRRRSSELHKEGFMTTGRRLFCREFLCFNTTPCRHMPILVHF